MAPTVTLRRRCVEVSRLVTGDESDVERAVQRLTGGPRHHFFGYYDKCPWDSTGRYLLALEAGFMDRAPGSGDAATVGMVDLARERRWISLAETSAWNWQQGAMLQWLPAAPDRLIIYNMRLSDRFVSVIRDVGSGEARTLPRPVYAISRDGRSALTLNFSRVHHCRPGYGYEGVPDPWAEDPAPEEDGIWWMDLRTGESRLILSLARVAALEPQPSMEGTRHWFNHLEFNGDDSRFVFLHRWRGEGMWRTRMFTARPDGSELHCLAHDDYVSHFAWRDRSHILAWAHQRETGVFYYLFTDQSQEKEIVGGGILTVDGHCSYSPDRRWILTDSYPDPDSKRSLILFRPADGRRVTLGRFYSPPELSEEIRCDLHPRWNRDGTQTCIDSAHEGERQVYVMDVGDIVR
jgi:hypothetical protein